ncbi:STAS domain-containing protein [Prauserella aidingensis]|uniref:STAS domain-containing protein n=1 Tax=Prauserella aidingensis TaxID=387890 RepID=UPI0020A243F7|nr:STAS domain-containing protein [Prauserella aidingensis]MCP2251463.1 STAS domain-containing protein [Prauserella aidingensis]
MRADDNLTTTVSAVFAVESDLADANVALLAERLWPHVLTGPPETLVDLARTTTIDAAGLDLLSAAHTYAAHRHIAFHIVNAAPHLHGMLQAAGVSALPAAHRPRAAFAITTRPPPQSDTPLAMA